MTVGDQQYETVWIEGNVVYMIQQNKLPFEFVIHKCHTYWDTCLAITDMVVRGAGAIGAAAGYAMAQAFLMAKGKNRAVIIREARQDIEATRPTARNLFYAVERVYQAGLRSAEDALVEAKRIAREDAMSSKKIGEYGAGLIEKKANIMTHCNAGWLALLTMEPPWLLSTLPAIKGRTCLFMLTKPVREAREGGLQPGSCTTKGFPT